MKKGSKKSNPGSKNPERQKRLAEALRENLKKRKAQPKRGKTQKT